jgi:hypothetical protein
MNNPVISNNPKISSIAEAAIASHSAKAPEMKGMSACAYDEKRSQSTRVIVGDPYFEINPKWSKQATTKLTPNVNLRKSCVNAVEIFMLLNFVYCLPAL